MSERTEQCEGAVQCDVCMYVCMGAQAFVAGDIIRRGFAYYLIMPAA